MQVEQGENGLLTGPIGKQLVLFGAPLLLGNLFQQLYGSVDSVIVGRYVGSGALAAVGSTTALVFLVVSFFQGVATGANVVISQLIGRGRYGGVRVSIATALLLAAAGGAVLAAAAFALTPTLLRWMLTPADIFEMTAVYLRVYMLSLPAVALYNTGTAVLRSMGDSRRPLLFLMLSSGVNVALDLLFICVLRMGVAGAAWATLLSQALSAGLVCYVLFRHADPYTLAREDLRPDPGTAREILRLGLPAAVQSSAVSFANVLFQSQVNLFGSVAVAGYSAGSRINAFLYMPVTAFGLAVTTFAAQNYGAGLFRRVRRGANISLGLSAGITLLGGALCCLFRFPLLRLFTAEEEVLEYGALMLLVIGMTSFLWAFPHIYGSVITGMGKSFSTMLVTMINMCGVRLLWIFTMLRVWDDILVIYLSFPVSWITASACMVVYYRRLAGRMLPPEEGGPAGRPGAECAVE